MNINDIMNDVYDIFKKVEAIEINYYLDRLPLIEEMTKILESDLKESKKISYILSTKITKKDCLKHSIETNLSYIDNYYTDFFNDYYEYPFTPNDITQIMKYFYSFNNLKNIYAKRFKKKIKKPLEFF